MDKNDKLQLTALDLDALQCFRDVHPTWWYSIGVCDLTRDFTCAPQPHSPEQPLIENGNSFDCGFMCDHQGSLADAIYDVMAQIVAAVKEKGV